MATNASQTTALRKRQQIAQANRVMFFWVAGASAIVGIAAVLSITLFNKLTFNQEIITHQAKTAGILTKNVDAAKELAKNAQVLNTDPGLLEARANPEDKPLQAILDALPSSANRAALGASLQSVLLQLDGVAIDKLNVDGSDNEVAAEAGGVPVGTAPVESNGASVPLGFSFTAKSADINKLFDLLARLESSIRPIKIIALDLEMGSGEASLIANAESYYQSGINIDLGQETLPKKGKR